MIVMGNKKFVSFKEQMEDKKYHIELERYGVKAIIKIAYVFDGKEVVSSN